MASSGTAHVGRFPPPVCRTARSHQSSDRSQSGRTSGQKPALPLTSLSEFPGSLPFGSLEIFHFLASLVIHIKKCLLFCLAFELFSLEGPPPCSCENKNWTPVGSVLRPGFIGCDFRLVQSRGFAMRVGDASVPGCDNHTMLLLLRQSASWPRTGARPGLPFTASPCTVQAGCRCEMFWVFSQ